MITVIDHDTFSGDTVLGGTVPGDAVHGDVYPRDADRRSGVPHGEVQVPGEVRDGRILVTADGWARATGWTIEPHGLCRGEVCVPIPPGTSVLDGDAVDLAAAAEVLRRPIATDAACRVAVLGSTTRSDVPAVGEEASDFTLADLDGRPVSLHDFTRRKRLLIAWASW